MCIGIDGLAEGHAVHVEEVDGVAIEGEDDGVDAAAKATIVDPVVGLNAQAHHGAYGNGIESGVVLCALPAEIEALSVGKGGFIVEGVEGVEVELGEIGRYGVVVSNAAAHRVVWGAIAQIA